MLIWRARLIPPTRLTAWTRPSSVTARRRRCRWRWRLLRRPHVRTTSRKTRRHVGASCTRARRLSLAGGVLTSRRTVWVAPRVARTPTSSAPAACTRLHITTCRRTVAPGTSACARRSARLAQSAPCAAPCRTSATPSCAAARPALRAFAARPRRRRCADGPRPRSASACGPSARACFSSPARFDVDLCCTERAAAKGALPKVSS